MKNFILSTLFILAAFQLYSQNGASINTTGASADPSAMLDVSGTSKGVLINRMNTIERNAIVAPAEGLQIYNLDCHYFEYFNGTQWVAFSPVNAGITINASPVGAICKGASVTFTATPLKEGPAPVYQWKVNGVNVGTNDITFSSTALTNGDIVSCELTSNETCISSNTATSNEIIIIVNQMPGDAGTITGDFQVCQGVAGLTFSVPYINNATSYTWTYSGTGALINGSSNQISIDFSSIATSGDLTITGNNSCGNGKVSNPHSITIVEPPTTANAGTDIYPLYGATTATLSGNTPITGSGLWTITSGTATITNPASPNSGVTGLATSGTAILNWTITNSPCPASSDEVVITSVPWNCGSSVITDSRDGKIYNTVQIGSQCWMKENLNVGNKINGTAEQSNNSQIEKYCYNNNDLNCTTYGGLYQWAEAIDYYNGASNSTSWSVAPNINIQGICPDGWHIPSDYELYIMENFIDPSINNPNSIGWRGTDAGTKMKANSSLWNTNTGSNTSGFTALPAGYRISDGSFADVGNYIVVWSASENGPTYGWRRVLGAVNSSSSRYHLSPKVDGGSVRCILD